MLILRRLWEAIDFDPVGPASEAHLPTRGLEIPTELRDLLMRDFSDTVPAAAWVQQDRQTRSCAS